MELHMTFVIYFLGVDITGTQAVQIDVIVLFPNPQNLWTETSGYIFMLQGLGDFLEGIILKHPLR